MDFPIYYGDTHLKNISLDEFRYTTYQAAILQGLANRLPEDIQPEHDATFEDLAKLAHGVALAMLSLDWTRDTESDGIQYIKTKKESNEVK